jgi:hypothetical protein
MEKPSASEIWESDDAVIDLLVHDNEAEQAPEEIKAEQNSNRLQLFCMMDRYTKLIMSYRLSFEDEEMKSDH